MSAVAIPISHIRLDESGRPWIDGTSMKVIELVAGVVAYGWTAEDLALQYPSLSRAQIHGALSYYYDNQAAIESELDRISRESAIARSETLDSPLRQRLRGSRGIG